jgi:hypothetical protein
MAKMSGGMGMLGMFGAMPPPVAAPPKKKKQTSTDDYEPASPTVHAPPVPVMALPGMASAKTSHVQPKEEDQEDETGTPHVGPITGGHAPEEVVDVEDIEPVAPLPPRQPESRSTEG